jgi:hypothetical protein
VDQAVALANDRVNTKKEKQKAGCESEKENKKTEKNEKFAGDIEFPCEARAKK